MFAPVKRTVPDASEGIWEVYLAQTLASIEDVIADGNKPGRQGYPAKPMAVAEGPMTDAGDARWNPNFHQSRVTEGHTPDCTHRLRKLKCAYAGPRKRLFTDDTQIGGKADGAELGAPGEGTRREDGHAVRERNLTQRGAILEEAFTASERGREGDRGKRHAGKGVGSEGGDRMALQGEGDLDGAGGRRRKGGGLLFPPAGAGLPVCTENGLARRVRETASRETKILLLRKKNFPLEKKM